MLKIGITGGIGSGKTTVSKIFELLGISVFYADDVAKRLMTEDEDLIINVKSLFGSNAYTATGLLNRKYISGIVFSDDEALADLNRIVHPVVFKNFDSWAIKQKSPYVIKEAALLFESGSYKSCQANILVKSTQDLKIKRLMKRDGSNHEQIFDRMNKQMDDSEKEKIANFFIENDEKHLLIPQVLRLHEVFVNELND